LEKEIRGEKLIALEIPLLFESRMHDLCDKVLVVTARKEQMIERKEKQGMKKEETEKRMQNQMNVKEKRKKADFVLENNGSLKELQEKINELTAKIKEEIK